MQYRHSKSRCWSLQQSIAKIWAKSTLPYAKDVLIKGNHMNLQTTGCTFNIAGIINNFVNLTKITLRIYGISHRMASEFLSKSFVSTRIPTILLRETCCWWMPPQLKYTRIWLNLSWLIMEKWSIHITWFLRILKKWIFGIYFCIKLHNIKAKRTRQRSQLISGWKTQM